MLHIYHNSRFWVEKIEPNDIYLVGWPHDPTIILVFKMFQFVIHLGRWHRAGTTEYNTNTNILGEFITTYQSDWLQL